MNPRPWYEDPDAEFDHIDFEPDPSPRDSYIGGLMEENSDNYWREAGTA